jgi:hypothetical protein
VEGGFVGLEPTEAGNVVDEEHICAPRSRLGANLQKMKNFTATTRVDQRRL